MLLRYSPCEVPSCSCDGDHAIGPRIGNGSEWGEASGRRRPVKASRQALDDSWRNWKTGSFLTLLGQRLFPSDNPWNQNISNAPVAANSAAVIAHIGSSIRLHPDWGADSPANGNGPLYGIPVQHRPRQRAAPR